MTEHEISKNLLKFDQAKRTMVIALILNICSILLFITSDMWTAGVIAVATIGLLFSYFNVKKGKTGGFYVGAIMYALNVLIDFVAVFFGLFDISLMLNIIVSAYFIIVFIGAIKSKKEIPEDIDIQKSLKAYDDENKRKKKERTFDKKAAQNGIIDGTFRMPLVYKDNFNELDA